MSSTMTNPSDAEVVVPEAIVTDHPAHEELIENIRIDRTGRALYQMPHYPLAIVVLLGLLLVLAALAISLG